jgi:4-amino-4-deoxy-L-arabinose transferase-like glycosyltransferase
MRDRVRDHALLLFLCALLTLPNLGKPSFWDLDEGVNAEAAREMRNAGTWVIPTYNYQLRTAKPAMIYWLQRISYDVFGVNEWAARFPSVLASWVTVLLVYELARRMFDRRTGLCSGIILASVAQFGLLAHAATPDAVLLTWIILAFTVFWFGHAHGGRKWWVPMAAACGLAMLTKGPVGVVLPAIIVVLYFAWNGEWRRLLDHRCGYALLTFLLVAAPWYGLVAGETRGEWVKTFLTKENLGRFMNVMDRHEGWVGYYPSIMLIMFAPWSAFILPTLWYGMQGSRSSCPRWVAGLIARSRSIGRRTIFSWHPAVVGTAGVEQSLHDEAAGECAREATPMPGIGSGDEAGASLLDNPLPESVRAYRFLLCCVVAYLGFFSIAATKLPNYIFPIYPALAILAARFLVTWSEGRQPVPKWMIPATIGGMTVVGLAYIVCFLIGDRTFPGLAFWSPIGLIPLLGAFAMARYLRRNDRAGVVNSALASAVVFLGLTLAFPPLAIEGKKAPRELVRTSGIDNPDRDIRVAAFRWLLPSVVFYSGREVKIVPSAEGAAAFLEIPTPGYLFVSEPIWTNYVTRWLKVPFTIVARHYDFLEKCDILVISNQLPGP